ncbi:MAG: TlpA family protein disulfide reductase [Prevotella sp.]|nr:TlpA family protein disulfide reductase [Prevotella sp.]
MKKLIFLNIAAMLLTACQMKGNNTETTQEQTAQNAAIPAEGTEVGNKYIDIKLPGIQGNNVAVSDYVAKNRYTLIDFWASWCPPCRAEMPTIVKAYAQYHAQGFEVVGVSLDNNREAWLAALERLGMTWPQMSDLKGWECQGAQLYHIQAIPANVLVDQQGIIVAKDLRGESLLQKIAELMH